MDPFSSYLIHPMVKNVELEIEVDKMKDIQNSDKDIIDKQNLVIVELKSKF